MAIVQTKIINCKTASIRRIPWLSLFDREIVGEKKLGEAIEIDTSEICYDRNNRKFYKTRNPKGWVHDGVIEYGGE